jgi:ABC-type sugar transport system substrate-binding protein
MKINLNDDMILAIGVAIKELGNPEDFPIFLNYLDEEEIDRITDGIQQIKEQLNELNK